MSKEIKLAECVFDITSTICYVTSGNTDWWELGFGDSRNAFHTIYAWACEFERENPEPEDYMEEIDRFAYKKLKEMGFDVEGGESDDGV